MTVHVACKGSRRALYCSGCRVKEEMMGSKATHQPSADLITSSVKPTTAHFESPAMRPGPAADTDKCHGKSMMPET